MLRVGEVAVGPMAPVIATVNAAAAAEGPRQAHDASVI